MECNICNVSSAHFQAIPDDRLRIFFYKKSMTTALAGHFLGKVFSTCHCLLMCRPLF
jgi:hypothetical protein